MEWGGEAIFMIGNLAVIQHSGLSFASPNGDGCAQPINALINTLL
jgi:hypothetical protein